MAIFSPTFFLTPKTLFPSPLFFTSKPPKLHPTTTFSSTTTTTTPSIHTDTTNNPPPTPTWKLFSDRVSGEWDGFGADFTIDGHPIELPYNVVPSAFREWDIQLYDWQTQCPTLAKPTAPPSLLYKLVRLLPTVGCEADAATRYSVLERDTNMVVGFGYEGSGCYVAVWKGEGVMEVEHCLVDPRDREVRVRVVQVVRVGDWGMRVERIKAFSEQWYGEFRNGESLGGCAIREAGFAATEKVAVEKVVGEWEGRSVAVASFEGGEMDKIRELVADTPHKSFRDELGIVVLPKQLWCSFKEKDGESLAEVGWLFDHGCAMVSRCTFHQDGSLKDIAVGRETATLKGT